MRKHLNAILLTGVVLFSTSAVSARAAELLFDFNTLTSGKSASAIALYMDGVLGGACAINLNCVTVTGAVADRTYNGENHVVGPNGVSRTLGNTDGATDNSSAATSTTNDTFISNITDQSSQISSEMIIQFSHGVVLNGNASFDYEIFPDNTCATRSTCGNPLNPPDFTFAENGNSGSPIFTTLAVFPSATGSNGSSIHSPFSGTGTEQSAQYIGHWSGTFTNVTELDFIDWPAAIGVDNIYIGTEVPEPRGEAILLGGLLLAVFAGNKLRRAFAKA